MQAARVVAEKAKRDGIVPTACGETTNEWFVRFLAARTARGLASVSDDKSRYENHIAPRVGTLAVRDITRSHIEALVEELDAKVQSNRLSWKTASHTCALPGFLGPAVTWKLPLGFLVLNPYNLS